jgi:uncharacterized protein (TIGR02118 family)
MIKISVLYKNAENATFNMDYFLGSHVPMLKGLIGDKIKNLAVEQGIAGGPAPGTPAPFLAMAHLFFDNMDDFQASMASGAEAIMNDIPNYTNAEPIIQISEVKL